uniref:Mitochondrial carrier protein n=1 Tax=Paramoeba aestuarina TaxID=180227 RepID=A0A7S4P7M3_9EUKA|mmetsp:Transcript_37510/g.59133  ORF Transcript_37510/g.59133 Transcript_37510/m.59133 type:complete len:231 (+) Transcript_37510:64-756(+)
MVNSGFALFLYRPIRESLSQSSFFNASKKGGEGEGKLPLWWKMGIAAGGSAVGQMVSTPMDVLKVRLQADGHRKAFNKPPLYENMTHAWVTIYKGEGLRGFWKGWQPGVQRSAIVGGVGLSVYDQCKDELEQRGVGRGSTIGQVMASFVSGVSCVLVSVPLDVVKVRMMAKGGEGVKGGVVRMMATIAKQEGFLALYKGLLPTYVRMAPWQFVFFVTMENIMGFLSGEWF